MEFGIIDEPTTRERIIDTFERKAVASNDAVLYALASKLRNGAPLTEVLLEGVLVLVDQNRYLVNELTSELINNLPKVVIVTEAIL